MKRFIRLILTFSILMNTVFGVLMQCSVVEAATIPKIKYCTHVQDRGWLGWVTNGATSGTTGQAKRMEALKITLNKKNKSMIKYRSHVQNIGWQKWVTSGKISGTTGKYKAVEAIQIQLTGEYKNKYDIYYRLHVRDFGWLGWAKNGKTSGSEGLSARAEAVQIKLVKKGAKFSTGGVKTLVKPAFTYKAHIQDYGWLKKVGEGKTGGSTGKAKRLEALALYLKDFSGKNGISYRAHVAGSGWESSWKSQGQVMGTTGQSKAIEAVQIKLSSSLSAFFDVYYRIHSSNIGWLGWAKNGESAGTVGGGVPAEAIQIVIVVKNSSFNRGGTAFKDLSTSSNYDRKVEGFINDSRWRNGIVWNGGQTPKLSSWQSYGCCAYAADFTKYVFNANSQNSGAPFYNVSEIRSGDVIHTGSHWFVILYRNGNKLTTAEGNVTGKNNGYVRISSNAYSIGSFNMRIGYHYQ